MGEANFYYFTCLKYKYLIYDRTLKKKRKNVVSGARKVSAHSSCDEHEHYCWCLQEEGRLIFKQNPLSREKNSCLFTYVREELLRKFAPARCLRKKKETFVIFRLLLFSSCAYLYTILFSAFVSIILCKPRFI